ncbi:dihydrolipoamide acetyltransferase family protein [Actinocorallia aurantiaca]|uniref:Dihydrolipoamide acetyltransferase component of pyruvate dehydrogenase complex n=1 Tax=Actinocorallia aurantiaca TaxID=46204 RepID=A0ABN3UB98_9ACTN
MVRHFRLPDVGEGLTEAEIVRWHVAPGDSVELNQTVVEIETAKAIVELPSPYEGVVAELLVDEGDTVAVGTPIIGVREPGEGAPEPKGSAPEQETRPPKAGEETIRTPVLVGYGVKPASTRRRPRRPANRPAAAPPAGRALAKPPVRKLAKDLGVDLSTVVGTGPEGTVTREDVRASVETAGAVAPAERERPPTPPRSADEERIPVKGVRKATAAAMVSSAFSAPHVTEFLQVDVTRAVKTVERLRALPEYAELKISPMLLVSRALLTAVRRHPMINSSWDEEAREIVVKRRVNLGVAVAAERGLLVPNLKDAHALPLPELAAGLSALIAKARDGRCDPADLTGGTITITNVGVFGVDAGTPILSPGESAILAVGRIRELPWMHRGKIKPRRVATLSLSFDHRVVDGELGSAVLRETGALLEDPFRLLALG